MDRSATKYDLLDGKWTNKHHQQHSSNLEINQHTTQTGMSMFWVVPIFSRSLCLSPFSYFILFSFHFISFHSIFVWCNNNMLDAYAIHTYKLKMNVIHTIINWTIAIHQTGNVINFPINIQHIFYTYYIRKIQHLDNFHGEWVIQSNHPFSYPIFNSLLIFDFVYINVCLEYRWDALCHGSLFYRHF